MKSRCLALLILSVVACRDGQPPNPPVALTPQPGIKVDSILPTEIALERFLSSETRVDSLTHGARSRDDLIARFFDAISSRDSSALGALLVTRAEYGFLYYPTSIYSRKPYELAPDVAWMLNSGNNAKGAGRLLARLGGKRAVHIGTTCGKESDEGSNRFVTDCITRYRTEAGREESRQLFGAIMERSGRLKFLSFAGDF